MADYVLVPQSDIDKLEQARKDLHDFMGSSGPGSYARIAHITEPMWKIAHRKYPCGCPNWDANDQECADRY